MTQIEVLIVYLITLQSKLCLKCMTYDYFNKVKSLDHFYTVIGKIQIHQ